jgi:hypothetical protein
MGISISLVAKLPRSTLGMRVSATEAFKRARRVVEGLPGMDDPLVEAMVSFQDGKDQHGNEVLQVHLHPGAEPITLAVESGHLVLFAKTSTLGPGYHCAVVEFADGLAKEGFAWQDGSGAQGQHGDDARYFEDRDMGVLVSHMTKIFAQLMQVVVENAAKGINGLLINCSMSSMVPQVRETMTPLGPRSLQWCKVAASKPELFVEQFYPWWRPGRDAGFWKSSGLSMLWTDIRWHPPETESEHARMTLALACLDRAKEMDANIVLPDVEMEELRAFKAASEGAPGDDEPPPALNAPKANGIGYWRGDMLAMLPGGWSVTMPGYYYDFVEQDGECQGWSFGPRVVRISTISMGEDGEDIPPPPVPEGFTQVKQMKGWVLAEKPAEKSDEPGEEYMISLFFAQAGTKLAFVTICYNDPADVAWARSVASTLSPP